MNTRTVPALLAAMTLLAGLALVAILGVGANDTQAAGGDKTGKRLLRTSEDLQYPSYESDATWTLVFYEGFMELPDAATFEQISGCPVTEGSSMSRLDFDAILDSLDTVQSWMDESPKRVPAPSASCRGCSAASLATTLPSTAANRTADGASIVSWTLYFPFAALSRATRLSAPLALSRHCIKSTLTP